MFQVVRAKLITSYTIVIMLCLVLAGSAFVYILRDYQRQIKLGQLADMVQPLYLQVRLLEQAGASREQISSFLQDSAEIWAPAFSSLIRLALVVEDTYHELSDYRIDLPGGPDSAKSIPRLFCRLVWRPEARQLRLRRRRHAPRSSSVNWTGSWSRCASYKVVLAVPEQSLTPVG